MASGQLEVMVNRKSQSSDELGNPEVLNEAEGCCGMHGCPCSSPMECIAATMTARTHPVSTCAGVIARGLFQLILGDGRDSAHAHALQAQQMAWPVLLSFVKASGASVNDQVRHSPGEPTSL